MPELVQERSQLTARLDALNAIKDRDLTDEERAAYKADDLRLDAVLADIEILEAQEKHAKRTAKPVAPEKRVGSDPYASMEYREAFKRYVTTGERTPELRLDAQTTTTEAAAVIPTTILNEIIQKLKEYGQIFARVRKTSIKGGVQVPILSIKPTATWINETTVSDRKNVNASTNVSFTYFGLECKIATSLLADSVTLEGFESTVVDVVTEAMVIALETAIVKGAGSTQPLGITADTSRIPAAQIVTLASADFADWGEWKKQVFAKMPIRYKAGAVWLMAGGTFEGYIDGMTDANGQPVGRINYGITEGPQERFSGKPVIQVEDDIIANYDDASTGDVVAILCRLGDYCINSNMQMTMYRYLDHDTNQYVDKAILIADGKLLDPNGVVIVKKGA